MSYDAESWHVLLLETHVQIRRSAGTFFNRFNTK